MRLGIVQYIYRCEPYNGEHFVIAPPIHLVAHYLGNALHSHLLIVLLYL